MPVTNSERKQVYIALMNALGTVDAFVIPSGNPDIWEKYEAVKAYLKKHYHIENFEDYIYTDDRRTTYNGEITPPENGLREV